VWLELLRLLPQLAGYARADQAPARHEPMDGPRRRSCAAPVTTLQIPGG
jgi:hypothetical protein